MMKRLMVFVCIMLGCILLCETPCVWSCTDIKLTQGNYRVQSREAGFPTYMDTLAVLSPRGVQRTSRNTPAGDTPLRWTAVYGSVGFNALGENCADGINEKGLAGGILEQEDSKYPTAHSDRALSVVYWLQYYLDTCQTVEEAVAAAPGIKIYMPPDLPIQLGEHLILHDRTGDSVVMEYDGSGNLNIYRPDIDGAGPDYIYNGVITNEPLYPVQIANLLNYKPWGGALDLPGSDAPAARFVRASYCLKQMYTPTSSAAAIALAFDYIEGVVEPMVHGEDKWPTWWVTIRDLDNLEYYFNTFYRPGIKSIALSALDFTQGQSIKMQNIDVIDEGDVSDDFIAATVSAAGKFSYKGLSINPHNLVSGSLLDYTIYLGETISQKFDLYVLADTPFGTYTMYPAGNMKSGIHKVLRNVAGITAPREYDFVLFSTLPRSLAGEQVTFYVAAVQAGKAPPVAKLSDLTESTQYVIMMDKESMTIK